MVEKKDLDWETIIEKFKGSLLLGIIVSPWLYYGFYLAIDLWSQAQDFISAIFIIILMVPMFIGIGLIFPITLPMFWLGGDVESIFFARDGIPNLLICSLLAYFFGLIVWVLIGQNNKVKVANNNKVKKKIKTLDNKKIIKETKDEGSYFISILNQAFGSKPFQGDGKFVNALTFIGYFVWLIIGAEYFFDLNVFDNDYFSYYFFKDLQDYTGYIGVGVFVILAFFVAGGTIIYAPFSILVLIYLFIKKEGEIAEKKKKEGNK